VVIGIAAAVVLRKVRRLIIGPPVFLCEGV
jgi:hypothetical protein